MSVRTCSFRVFSLALVLCALAVAPDHAYAQFRRPAPRQSGQPADPLHRETVQATVTLVLAGRAYDAAGPAVCSYAPNAFLYGKAAQLWTVEMQPRGGSLQSVQLTFWRMKDGAATTYYSVSANASGKSHRMSRPIPEAKSNGEGRGSVTLVTSGPGGRFSLEGMSAAGAAMKGNVECQRFTAAIAEGG